MGSDNSIVTQVDSTAGFTLKAIRLESGTPGQNPTLTRLQTRLLAVQTKFVPNCIMRINTEIHLPAILQIGRVAQFALDQPSGAASTEPLR